MTMPTDKQIEAVAIALALLPCRADEPGLDLLRRREAARAAISAMRSEITGEDAGLVGRLEHFIAQLDDEGAGVLEINNRDDELQKDLRALLDRLASMAAEIERLAYAVWMVGNMDTDDDKAAWRREFDGIWKRAGDIVAAAVKRGAVAGQGFEAFEQSRQALTTKTGNPT